MRHHRTTASTSDFTRSRARPRDAFDSVRFRSIPFDPFESIRSDRRARPRPRRRGPLTRYDPPPSRLDAPCQRIHAHTNAPAPFSRRHRRRARPAARSPRVPAFARARPRGVENAFFFFISCGFSFRDASTRRGRETSPRDIPIESNSQRFRSVRFRSTSVSVVGWIVSRADEGGRG